MNKSELITEVARKTGMPKKDVKLVVKAVFDSMEEELEEGNKVQIVGFGTFSTSKVAAHVGVNPQNREESVFIEESTRVHFSAGQSLKDRVNHRK